MSEIKILDQDATNAAIAAAMQQMKDYVDGNRADLPVQTTSAAAFDTEITTAAQALAYAHDECTEFTDESTTSTDNPYLWYKAKKLEKVRYMLLSTFDDDSTENLAFLNILTLQYAMFDTLSSLDSNSLQFMRGCINVKIVNFPSLTTISSSSNYAFYGMSSLVTANFPSLTTISSSSSSGNSNNYAFYGMSSLVTANFPSLTTISGSSSISSTYNYAFYGMSSLVTANFPSLTTISSSGNNSNSYHSYNYALSNMNSLKSISFPKLTTIKTSGGNQTTAHNYFLASCPSLETVSIGTDLSSIVFNTSVNVHMACFSSCPNLIDIRIGGDNPAGDNVPSQITASFNLLKGWNPTTVLADPTKLATMNANIRNHIAAYCANANLTITFNTAMNGKLEAATIQAFTDKGWTVAYA